MSNNENEKSLIEQLYFVEKKSMRKIASIVGLSYSGIQYKFKSYGIKPRTKSEAQLGEANPQYKKGSFSGRHHSIESKQIMSDKRRGCNHPMFGYKMSEEELDRRYRGCNNPFYGKKHTEETLKLISGANNWNWKGGITKLANSIRLLQEYIDWRKSCFVRDNFKCILCSSHQNIQVDHIKQFAIILKENNVNSISQAKVCKELWDVNNGRTLCKNCHLKTPTHGKKLKYA